MRLRHCAFDFLPNSLWPCSNGNEFKTVFVFTAFAFSPGLEREVEIESQRVILFKNNGKMFSTNYSSLSVNKNIATISFIIFSSTSASKKLD